MEKGKNIQVIKIKTVQCSCNNFAEFRILHEEEHTEFLCKACLKKKYPDAKIKDIFEEETFPGYSSHTPLMNKAFRSWRAFSKKDKNQGIKLSVKQTTLIGILKLENNSSELPWKEIKNGNWKGYLTREVFMGWSVIVTRETKTLVAFINEVEREKIFL